MSKDLHIRPFAEVLRMIGRGRAETRAAEKFHAINQAVRDTGKPGKLTITITVKPGKEGDQLNTETRVTAVIPEFELQTTTYWLDGQGNPTRSDPDQLTLGELKEIKNDDTKAPKEARA